MDPTGGLLVGLVVGGVAVNVVYRLAKRHQAPVQGGSAKGSRTAGKPKKSWLVTFVNSAGAKPTTNTDLKGASAEWTGRAAGGAVRSGRQRGQRAWAAVTAAAERRRKRREQGWQNPGRPPLFVVQWPGWRTLWPRRTKPAKEPGVTKEPSAKPDPSTTATPGPEPPERHLKAVPDPQPEPGVAVTTTDAAAPTVLAAPQAPADWALMTDRVRNFVPEDDAALIAFMRGEAVGVVGYAEGLEQARENCTNDVGLDPSAVQGFVVYSEHMSDAAERMTEAYRLFMAVYGEVQALAANGVVLPHNGRWFTGAAG